MKRGKLDVRIEVQSEPIDLDSWATIYVGALMELEKPAPGKQSRPQLQKAG